MCGGTNTENIDYSTVPPCATSGCVVTERQARTEEQSTEYTKAIKLNTMMIGVYLAQCFQQQSVDEIAPCPLQR